MTDGPEVTFGHGRRHIEGLDLTQATVEAAIREDISRTPVAEQGVLERRRIIVEGVEVEYRVWWVDTGKMHVGTYFPVTP